jgi:hypothetical protein
MNYLYQVAGLTDASGNEHLDYSYGLELPMSENLLSSLIPMGIQQYKVRYFGPYNSAIDTPGQASQVYCSGNLLTGSEGQYVLLQGPSVSTPDWSNGTILPLGKLITSGLDINYDGTESEIFTDSPDWLSLNLQQVSARASADGISADLGKGDIGASDLGKGDIGTSDLGKGDIGTSALGADALGDFNFTSFVLSGAAGPPTGLQVQVYVPPSSTAGGTGNILNWIANTGVASSYKIYRCNASAGLCIPSALTSVNSGTPVATTYTDSVNDFVHAGSTCPKTSTCYNTTYNYLVTEVNTVGIYFIESGASNTVSSDVTHMFVVANSQTQTYGAANPTPTFAVYSNVAPAAYTTTTLATLLPGVSCGYNPTPLTNSKGYFDAGNYPVTCINGPAVVQGTTEGVTYYTTASPSLVYPTSPTNLGGTVTPGSLTINPLAITVTAVCSTKVYNATTTAGTVCTPANSPNAAIPAITTGSLVSGDSPAFTESYDNPNVNTPVGSHTMIPAGIVNDNNGGNNYKVTFVNSPATSVITPAPLTITATTNTKTYNGTTSAAAIPTTSVPCGTSTVTGPSTLCGNDTVTNLTEAYSSANAGNSVPITVSPGYVISDGNSGKNYAVTTNGTTGVINQAPVTTTAGSYTGTYNGASQSPSGCTVTPIGPNTYIGTLTCTNNPASVGPNAGSGTVTPTNTVGASDLLTNYAITSVNGSWKINPAPVTATAGSYSGTYNGASQSPSGCTVAPIGPNTYIGTLTCTNNPASVGPNVGSGTVTPTNTVGASDLLTNYAISSVTGSWKINPAPVTATAGSYSGTYNGAAQSPSACMVTSTTPPSTFTGTVMCVNNPASVGPNAGSGTVTPMTAVGANDSFNNYVITPVNGSWTINQATPTVTDSGPAPTAPDYGQPVTLTVTVAPPQSGETPTGTVTFSFTLNSVTNYICSNGSISTTLTPLCIIPGTFNGTNYVASVTTSNLPTAAENVMATYSGDPNFLGETANNVAVTVAQANSGVTLTKSADPSTYGSAVSLTVMVVDATGGSIGVPTGTVALSFVLDPTVPGGQVYYICADGTISTTACAPANQITLGANSNNTGATVTVQNIALPAGLATFANPGANPPAPFSYPINATYSGDTNFAASAPFGLSQTVNQLPVTATAGSYSGTYNGSTQSPSACIVTPISPSTSTGTLTCTNNPTSVGPNAGSGTVTPVPAVGANDSLNNYAITSVNGSWNINQQPVTVSLGNMTNQQYTGGSLSPTVTTNPSVAFSLTGAPDVNAGSYAVSAVVTNPNYTGSASGNFVINQYPLTVTATGVNKNFDGTTNATVTLSDNRIPGDNSISDSYTSASFASAGPGTGITVNVNGISISGAGMGNYALQNTTATTTANISNSINLANLALNGSVAPTAPTVLTGPVLQLTNSGGETSSAWLGTAIPVSSAFTTTFQFQITPASTSANSIGDGFAFVIQGAPSGAATLGLTGYGMYIGYDGIRNSIAIEFDTYQNTGYGDPSSPHIGIQSNGAGANSPDHTSSAKLATPVAATFANGTLHSATIRYDGSSIISVYLDGSTIPIVSATVTGGLSSFLGLSGGPAYVGFTAGSGSAQETADILSWNWIWSSAPPSTPASFSGTGPLNTARSNPTLALLQNGQVLVTGGQSSTGSILASAELYDPNTGVFTPTTSPMNAARYVHTATLLPNGQVLITGGQGSSATLQSAELYNPATGTFSLTNSMTTPRSNQTATLLPNGQVLIAGGSAPSAPSSAELYNPSTGVFTATGSMGTDRYVANAALLPNGLVLIAGGISIPANTYLSSAELYNPATETFGSTGSMHSARGYFTLTALQNGQILAAGGGNPGQLTTAELYNAGTFSNTGPMTSGQGGPATLLYDGQVLVAGGYINSSNTYLAMSELYNAGTFSSTGLLNNPRSGSAATLLFDGQVLVVGGANSSGVLASAELYAPPN